MITVQDRWSNRFFRINGAHFVVVKRGSAALADVPKANFLHVNFYFRFVVMAQVSPNDDSVVGFIAPVRRSCTIVKCRYWILPIIVAIKFRRMNHYPNMNPTLSGEGTDPLEG